MKRLVFGTSYIDNVERREVVALWYWLINQLTSADILIVDSASPIPPESFLPPLDGTMIFRFSDNIGHLNITGRDGWGRAFCKGLEHAIDNGYDQVACIDTDVLFARPIDPIFDKLAATGVKCAAPMDMTYWFIEAAIIFFDVKWLVERNFIARYDWENPPAELSPANISERRVELACGNDFFCLPLRGLRNDKGMLKRTELVKERNPYGLDYLTHLNDFGLIPPFLQMNDL